MCCVARCSWTDMLNAVLVVFKRAKPNKAEPVSWTGSYKLYCLCVHTSVVLVN